MDYGSLFRTSLKTLRQNGMIWLISLLYPLSNIFLFLTRNLPVFHGFLSIIDYYLGIAGQLGVLLILYHGHLGQTVNFKELWKEVNSYFFRVLGIFFLLILLIVIPVGLLYLAVIRLPYIFTTALLGILGFYYFGFMVPYLQLGMFIKKFDIKYAAVVWSYTVSYTHLTLPTILRV